MQTTPPTHKAPAFYVAVTAVVALLVMGAGLVAWMASGERQDPAETGGAERVPRAELARHLERSPRDGRAWVLLARAEFEADRYADAAAAYERALAASPKVAADATVWCEYADALGMAQGGSLAGRPREILLRALALAPSHPKALEMAGSAAYEAGEPAAAAAYWRQLLPQLARGTRERAELEAAIARIEALADSPAVASAREAAGR